MPDNTTTQTTPGTTPVMTNADGTAINDGGRAGTRKTPDPTTVHVVASQPTIRTPTPRASFESSLRTPTPTPITQDTLLPNYLH